MYILHLQHISIQSIHILSVQYPCVAGGCHAGQHSSKPLEAPVNGDHGDGYSLNHCSEIVGIYDVKHLYCLSNLL